MFPVRCELVCYILFRNQIWRLPEQSDSKVLSWVSWAHCAGEGEQLCSKDSASVTFLVSVCSNFIAVIYEATFELGQGGTNIQPPCSVFLFLSDDLA